MQGGWSPEVAGYIKSETANQVPTNRAYRQVVRNKGSAGVDAMKVIELFSYLENNRDIIATSILTHTYVQRPIEAGASGQ